MAAGSGSRRFSSRAARELREVGTTNQTSLNDYARAITRQTALVLKVHRSNFFMDGFVESPPTEDIAALARKKRVPFVEDLGSGALIDTRDRRRPRARADAGRGARVTVWISSASAATSCSAVRRPASSPAAGRLVAALKREPLFRALRCDKLILSALEATVDAYLRGDADVPVLEMLRTTNDDLRIRAERIIAALDGLPLER